MSREQTGTPPLSRESRRLQIGQGPGRAQAPLEEVTGPRVPGDESSPCAGQSSGQGAGAQGETELEAQGGSPVLTEPQSAHA